MKKYVKQITACILSVFAFAAVLFNPVGSVRAEAADSVTFSNAFYDSFIEVSRDDYFFEYYHPSLDRVLQMQVPEKGGPYFLYCALVPYTLISGEETRQYRFYLLYPDDKESSGEFRYFKPKDNDYVSVAMSSWVWSDVIFKGQHYKMNCFYSSVFDEPERKAKFNMKYSVFSDVEQLNDFMSGKSDYAGEIYNSNNHPISSGDKVKFEKDNIYKRDLGYLKDVKYKVLSIKGANDSEQAKFLFSSISSSGFNVKQDNVYIRLYSQLACYDRKGNNILFDMPVNFVGTYDAKPLSFSVLRSKIFAVNDELWDKINDADFKVKIALKGYYRTDTLFLQIVQKNSDGTYNYGGYIKLRCKFNSSGDPVVSVTTETPDGGRDIDYSYTDKFAPTEGEGSNYEDAEKDADKTRVDNPFSALFQGFESFLSGFDGIVQVFQSFKSALFEIISYFGDFPTLISKTFPFLPTFITSSISVGFLLAVVLRFLGR